MTISRFVQSWNNSNYAIPTIGKATVTATTGSPTIDTTSRPGKTIYKFIGSGSITIGTAGYAEVLCIGGGGGGNSSGQGGAGGGAGGVIYNTSALLYSGTSPITIGGGGANSNTGTIIGLVGQATQLGSLIFAPGGGGGGYSTAGGPGASGGGGGGASSYSGGSAFYTGLGFNGGAIGWILPQQILRPISDVMVNLNKGAINNSPIQIQGGWVVIKVEDRRTMKVPNFEESKNQIRQALVQQYLQENVRRLRESAKVVQ